MKNIVYFSLFLSTFFLSALGKVHAQTPQYSVGANTGTNTIPLSSGVATSTRCQFIYQTGEFGAVPTGMAISTIYLRVGTATGASTYSNFQVDIGQSSVTTLGGTTWETGLTTALSTPTFSVGAVTLGQWIQIDLTTPIPYDPSLTLIIDLRYSAYTGGISLRTQSLAAGRRQYANYASAAPTANSPQKHDFGFDLISLNKPVNDASISALKSPSLFCPGTQDLKVVLTNKGKNVINTVNVDWDINGAPQSTIVWNQPIDTLGSVKNDTVLSVGTIPFAANDVKVVRVWTSMPNGLTDTVPNNDTLYVTLRPGLNGTYTVGTGGDFAGVAEAVTALTNYGTCGSVVFNILNGTYTGQFALLNRNVATMDSIIFQSVANDSAAVKITFPSSAAAADNFLFKVENSRNIVFRNLTFERSGTAAYSTVMHLHKTSDIRFEACHFTGPLSTAANTDGTKSAIFSDDTETEDRTLVENCKFTLNANALWFFSSISRPATGTLIRNNVFNNSYVNVFLKHHVSAQITGNKMSRGPGAAGHDYYAVSAENCDSALVIANNTMTYDRGYGIKVLGCNGTPAVRGKIYNNMISGVQTGTTLTYGFSIESSSNYSSLYLDFYHNTVLVNNTSATLGRAVNFIGTTGGALCDHIRIRNNILMNQGIGYVYYAGVNSVANNNQFNKNVVYTAGTSFGTWKNTINIPNNGLRSWIALTGQDSLSALYNVSFVSATDLHIGAGSAGNYNLASDITGLVPADIDGNTKATVLPYKGAHEAAAITAAANADAMVWTVEEPTSPLAVPGPQDLKVRVRNAGLSVLTNVDVLYILNGVPSVAPYSWTGSLQPGKDTLLNLGTITVATGANALSVWTQNTNLSLTDLTTLNDTIKIAFTAGGTPLNGVYTVGTGENYTTLGAVADALRNNKVTGNVVFELTTNYTGAGEVYPIRFSSPSLPSPFSITVRPAAGVTGRVTAGDPGSGNGVITLDSAIGISFDGRPGGTGTASEWIIRSTRTATTFASAIRLINGAQYNKFRYLTLEGQGTSTTIGLYTISTTTQATGNSFNILDSCLLRERTDVAAAYPYAGIYSAGTTGILNEYNQITNNRITNFTNNAILVTATGNGPGWTISGNHIYRTTPATLSQTVIQFVPGVSSYGNTISNNYLGGSAPFTTGLAYAFNAATTSFIGLSVTADTTLISNNTIKNIYVNGTGGATILLDIPSSTSRNITVANNVLGDSLGVDTTGTNKNAAFTGILSASTNRIDIRDNTVSNLWNYSVLTTAALRGIDHSGAGSTIRITGNRVFNLKSTTTNTAFTTAGQFAVNGIVSRVAGDALISGNKVYNIEALSTTTTSITAAGILSSGATSGDISRNTVYNIRNASTSTGEVRVYGIGVFDAPGANTVHHNFVSFTDPMLMTIFGIVHNNAAAQPGPIRLYYNTVYIGGTTTGTDKSTYAAYRLFKTPMDVKNNIFYNERIGTGTNHFAIGNNVDSANVNWISDYNLLYTPDSATRIAAVKNPAVALGYKAWRDTTNGDRHSVYKTVSFVAPSVGDLHLTGSSIGDHSLAGITIPGYTTDFDLQARHIYPYMGADENTGMPLPVKLVSFTGKKLGGDVMLDWITASETRNQGFVIERSADGRTYTEIGFVKTKGNTSQVQQYAYNDAGVFSVPGVRVVYYRLKQTDEGGTISFSNVVTVASEKADFSKQITVFPNPFNDQLILRLPVQPTDIPKVSITDIQGRVVYEGNASVVDAGSYTISLDERMDSGVYFGKVTAGGISYFFKCIKE